jgi:hemerythrin-like domain-containing protein
MATAKKSTASKKTASRNTAGKKTAGKTAGKKTAAKKSPAKKTTGRSQRADALSKLRTDHEAVKKMFNTYERKKDNMSNDEKAQLVQMICGELTVHAQIEEEMFYPALRQVSDDDLEEMLDEAQVEHQGAKDLIAQLQGGQPTDPLYDAKVTVLGEQVKHHADEEENNMFRKAKRSGVDLVVLGEQLEARSQELKGEMGLA